MLTAGEIVYSDNNPSSDEGFEIYLSLSTVAAPVHVFNHYPCKHRELLPLQLWTLSQFSELHQYTVQALRGISGNDSTLDCLVKYIYMRINAFQM